MPDKQLTVATYTAAASLAAITLVYVFAPTFFIDEQSASASASSRKKSVVGLSNPANDCFINSVLQALAGLGDLRLYLIRETHRRTLDSIDVYADSSEDSSRKSPPSWKVEGLQQGIVTHGLKEVLDALNERPLYKKTISASGFVLVLEKAFRQRISRQQQDAQEFLQVVAERLNDEYHAGHLARHRARAKSTNGHLEGTSSETLKSVPSLKASPKPPLSELPTTEHREDWAEDSEVPGTEQIHASAYIDEEGFPLEGTTESQIECLTCGFKPKPSETTFCTLTVNVPQVQSTSLSACFDGIFKTEHIDDFKCEKCRLVHAVGYLQDELATSDSEKSKLFTEAAIEKLQKAIEEDPEIPPNDVELPDSKFAPKRKIARHVRITKFPQVLAIHLSRSIFDYGQSSMKNSAKVAFPERLPLGGLINRRHYKLLAVTTHKGSHQSGHYETFRRQSTFPAFSTPNAINPNGAYYNTGSPKPSMSNSRQETSSQKTNDDIISLIHEESLSPASASSDSVDSSSQPVRLSTDSHRSRLRKRLSKISTAKYTSDPQAQDSPTPSTPNGGETSSLSSSIRRSARNTLSKVPSLTHHSSSSKEKLNNNSSGSNGAVVVCGSPDNGSKKNGIGKVSSQQQPPQQIKFKRKKRPSDRWWRISDEKVKESKTGEVLGMQKEVYLLFYELER